ncbi:unnamed protein product [Amoebophrya sp. A25]|nr:unnamed protein product [Amoebophrya sp. A25]|eukprot:GSA25T00026779001.1
MATPNAQFSREYLVHNGCAVLCLDCPGNGSFSFGIDNHLWETGPKFMGVKFIPPGAHFLYYSCGAAGGGSSVPVGEAEKPVVDVGAALGAVVSPSSSGGSSNDDEATSSETVSPPSGAAGAVSTSTTRDQEVSLHRCGFFAYLKPKEVLIRRWCPRTETLVRLKDPDEEARYRDGVKHWDFDLNMGEYPMDLYADWTEITRHISHAVISKIEPVGGLLAARGKEFVVEEETSSCAGAGAGLQKMETTSTTTAASASKKRALDSSEDTSKNVETSAKPNESDVKAVIQEVGSWKPPAYRGTDREQEDKRKALQEEIEDAKREANMASIEDANRFGRLFFSTIPQTTTAGDLADLSPSEITRRHLDKSHVIEKLVRHEYCKIDGTQKACSSRGGNKDTSSKNTKHDIPLLPFLALLGEVELAYVAFLLGQNYEAFEAWKQLIAILCSCTQLVNRQPLLYIEFLRVLYAQLQQAPEEFFVLGGFADLQDNFLVQSAVQLTQRIEDALLLEEELLDHAEMETPITTSITTTSTSTMDNAIEHDRRDKKAEASAAEKQAVRRCLQERVGHVRELLTGKFGQPFNHMTAAAGEGEDCPQVDKSLGMDVDLQDLKANRDPQHQFFGGRMLGNDFDDDDDMPQIVDLDQGYVF